MGESYMSVWKVLTERAVEKAAEKVRPEPVTEAMRALRMLNAAKQSLDARALHAAIQQAIQDGVPLVWIAIAQNLHGALEALTAATRSPDEANLQSAIDRAILSHVPEADSRFQLATGLLEAFKSKKVVSLVHGCVRYAQHVHSMGPYGKWSYGQPPREFSISDGGPGKWLFEECYPGGHVVEGILDVHDGWYAGQMTFPGDTESSKICLSYNCEDNTMNGKLLMPIAQSRRGPAVRRIKFVANRSVSGVDAAAIITPELACDFIQRGYRMIEDGCVEADSMDRAPACPDCCTAMEWSLSASGAYAAEWTCSNHGDKCESNAEAKGNGRWFCQACKKDYCTECHPKAVQVVYHWTPEKNFSSIREHGLVVPGGDSGVGHQTDEGYYGRGIYTSPLFDRYIGYGKGAQQAFLCLCLPGRQFQAKYPEHMGIDLRAGFDSHISGDHKDGPQGSQFIMFSSDHLLPLFLVERSTRHACELVANTLIKCLEGQMTRVGNGLLQLRRRSLARLLKDSFWAFAHNSKTARVKGSILRSRQQVEDWGSWDRWWEWTHHDEKAQRLIESKAPSKGLRNAEKLRHTRDQSIANGAAAPRRRKTWRRFDKENGSNVLEATL